MKIRPDPVTTLTPMLKMPVGSGNVDTGLEPAHVAGGTDRPLPDDLAGDEIDRDHLASSTQASSYTSRP